MRLLAAIGVLAIVIAIAAGVYLFGGYYNVAASSEDVGPVAWALTEVREASMDRHFHAVGEPPFKIDDPQMVKEGAHQFAERGCVNCHGAPGADRAGFSEGLNPQPPDLKDVNDDEPAHIFWAIKNGFRMTAMPSFGKAGVPDKDIWAIVAFLKKLPGVSSADFKSWTAQQ